MREKYIVRRDGIIFGVRIDKRKRELLVGGPIRFLAAMEDIVLCSGEIRTEYGRVRIRTNMSLSKLNKIVLKLERSYIVERVESFRRLMG